MKYLIAQPAIRYYTWQLEVCIYSLLNNGVKPEDIHIVSGLQSGKKDPGFDALEHKYKGVGFYYYYDNRKDRIYPPSIRPHILKKHWRANPELEKETFLYMEADTILLRPIKETKNFKNPKLWLCADTVNYIGHDYIIGRDPRFLSLFSNIIGIDPEVVKQNQENSGGAQYVLKGLTYEYWEKVEKDCVEIFRKGSELNKEIKDANPEWHELQIWTACMWAHLWNGWLMGYDTKVERALNFTWPANPKKELKSRTFFHNSGVFEDGPLLRKSNYMYDLPYGLKKNIDASKAGAYYYALVQEVGKNTVLNK